MLLFIHIIHLPTLTVKNSLDPNYYNQHLRGSHYLYSFYSHIFKPWQARLKTVTNIHHIIFAHIYLCVLFWELHVCILVWIFPVFVGGRANKSRVLQGKIGYQVGVVFPLQSVFNFVYIGKWIFIMEVIKGEFGLCLSTM